MERKPRLEVPDTWKPRARLASTKRMNSFDEAKKEREIKFKAQVESYRQHQRKIAPPDPPKDLFHPLDFDCQTIYMDSVSVWDNSQYIPEYPQRILLNLPKDPNRVDHWVQDTVVQNQQIQLEQLQEWADIMMTEQKPMVAEQKRMVPEPNPMLAVQKPMKAERKPVVLAEPNPMLDVQKPVKAERKPMMAEQKPMMSEPKPVVFEQKPLVVEQKPLMAEPKPMRVEQKAPIPQIDIDKLRKTIPIPLKPKQLSDHAEQKDKAPLDFVGKFMECEVDTWDKPMLKYNQLVILGDPQFHEDLLKAMEECFVSETVQDENIPKTENLNVVKCPDRF